MAATAEKRRRRPRVTRELVSVIGTYRVAAWLRLIAVGGVVAFAALQGSNDSLEGDDGVKFALLAALVLVGPSIFLSLALHRLTGSAPAAAADVFGTARLLTASALVVELAAVAALRLLNDPPSLGISSLVFIGIASRVEALRRTREGFEEIARTLSLSSARQSLEAKGILWAAMVAGVTSLGAPMLSYRYRDPVPLVVGLLIGASALAFAALFRKYSQSLGELRDMAALEYLEDEAG